MARFVYLIAASVSLTSFPPIVSADGYFTVEALLHGCEAAREGQEGYGSAYCHGVINGVAAVMRMNCMSMEDGAEPWLSLSMGEIPSVAAAQQAFINWAIRHPEKWGVPDISGASLALHETFPCEN